MVTTHRTVGSRASTDRRADAFADERPHLLAVAFRVLGSDADAQDVVQEAWARYARAELDRITNLQAWLTTVVTHGGGHARR